MSKILAIDLPSDASKEDLKIAENYSNMIREFFGNKTFMLNRLTSAMYKLPNDVAEYLSERFELFDENSSSNNYSSSFVRRAEKALKNLDESFQFLTETFICHLKELDSTTLNSGLENPSIDTIKISDTKLDARIKNALRYNGINTISDLRKHTLKEISRFRNIGEKSIEDLKKYVEKNFNLILD